MISLNTHQSVSQGGLEGNGMLGGLDLMTSIQILLVQDYDSQLKHLGRQMKVANQVKKAYRKEMEIFQKMQARETSEAKGDGNGKDWVKAMPDEYPHLDGDLEVIGNEFAENPDDMVVEKRTPYEDTVSDENTADGIYITRDAHGNEVRYYQKTYLDKRVQLLDTKLDSVNGQSELMGLKLQSLTNQRKTAFESVSNLFRKEAETLNTVVSNIRG